MDATEILTALTTPAGKADPYPHYAALHELGEVIEVASGVTAVVGYDAITAVLRDPAFRVSDEENFDRSFPGWRDVPVLVQGADWILNLNGPKHARIRSLIARAFTARRIAGLAPAIERMTGQLLDSMADRGADGSAVEFMQDFAYLLPVTVICELIGIPEADRAEFRPLARALSEVFEQIEPGRLPAINAAASELLAYFSELARVRRAHPQDDLISALLATADTGDGRLADAELLHNLTLLLVAGFETTTNLLGNGLHVILARPELAAGIRDRSIPAAGFVEETLRYDSPVQFTNRLGYETKLGEVAIASGDEVMTLLGAGNRDPRRFADPDVFDPLRSGAGPLSFGGGPHFCIGAALARLEGGIAFERLLDRFPLIGPAGEPARRQTFVLRGFDALPVAIG